MTVTQKEIAQRLTLHPATISKVLNRATNDYTSRETRQAVFALATELGYDFNHLKSVHSRVHPRKLVDLPVQVFIVMSKSKDDEQLIPPTPLIKGGTAGGITHHFTCERPLDQKSIWDRGQGRLLNLSPSGALLTDIKLTKNVLPLQSFYLRLVLENDSLSGLEIIGQVVRLETNGRMALGLKFETLSEESRKRLTELCINFSPHGDEQVINRDLNETCKRRTTPLIPLNKGGIKGGC